MTASVCPCIATSISRWLRCVPQTSLPFMFHVAIRSQFAQPHCPGRRTRGAAAVTVLPPGPSRGRHPWDCRCGRLRRSSRLSERKRGALHRLAESGRHARLLRVVRRLGSYRNASRCRRRCGALPNGQPRCRPRCCFAAARLPLSPAAHRAVQGCGTSGRSPCRSSSSVGHSTSTCFRTPGT